MSAFGALCRTSSGKQLQFVRCGADLFACKQDSGATRPNSSVGILRSRNQFFATQLPTNIHSAFISNSIAALRKLARMKRACEF
jgi:hypothetical protein